MTTEAKLKVLNVGGNSKVGFTQQYLIEIFGKFNFPNIFTGIGGWEIAVFAFKEPPSEQQLALLGLKAP